MSGRSKHWAAGIWLLVCMGLAGTIVFELSSPIAPEVTAAPPAAPMPEFAPPPDPFDPPPRQLFAEIAARPLFSESRRPFVPESEPEDKPQDDNIAIELVGTLLTKQGRAALLQPQGQNAQWVLAGEQVAGWEVVTIERDQVELRLDEEAKTLELRTDLVQPAPRRDKAERRRDRADAEPPDEDQAQAEEQAPEPAAANEDEADPSAD
jgi:general secretion pathway protein N